MRITRRFWLLAIALAAVLVLVLAACGSGDNSMPGMGMGNGATMAGTTTPASGQGASATATMPGMSGSPMAGMNMDTDLMFIDSMIPHHQSAIDMAKVAQEQAEHPEIKQLAGDIISAQQKEVDQLTTWRTQWFGNAPPTSGMSGMGTMAGMQMTDADMQQLRDADPFDQAFMTMMIPHHQSAIMMAQEILKTTQRPEIKQLANDIITSQQKEIDQMQAWLASWYAQ